MASKLALSLPHMPSSPSTPLSTWLCGALAWLIGAAGQTTEASLSGAWVYQGMVLFGMLACAAGPLSRWAWPGRFRRLDTAQVCKQSRLRWLPDPSVLKAAVLCLGLFLLAWGSTGWRASARMAEAWPVAWQGSDVPMCVAVQGLPQNLDGGALQFEAQVLSAGLAGCVADADPAAPPPVRRVTLFAQANDARPRNHAPDDEAPDERPRQSGLGQAPVQAGQIWRLVARLHAPDGASNPGGFDAPLLSFERGVRAVGSVRFKATPPVLLRAQSRWPWVAWIDRTRQRIRDGIQAQVPDARAAGVLSGLAVGDQAGITREDWEVFRRTGVAHLVSISGTHIAMLGWLAAMLVKPAWARWGWGRSRWPAPEAARWVAVGVALLYALLAGWGVPAQRTVLMMAVMAWLRSGGRRWPWPLVWLGSAVAVVVMDPWALRQVGFWLSYVAVGVLMASGQRPEDALIGADQGLAQGPASGRFEPTGKTSLAPWLQGLRSAAQASQTAAREMGQTQWLVTVALTPLALVCFQQVSVVGVGANMVAIPLFTLLITPLALLGVAWPPLWNLGAWLVNLSLAWLGEAASWPWAVWQAPVLPWWAAAAVILAGMGLLQPVPWRWRALALPFALPLLWLPRGWQLVPPPPPGQFTVMAADVGQGTAVLVRTAHHTLLFDTGPKIGKQSDAGERVLLPLLRALGVNQLDTLMISHQDSDHVGGAASLLGSLPVAGLSTSLDEAHPLRAMAGPEGRAPPHRTCLAGQHWVWDGVHFRVLHPTPADYADRAHLPPNALSCVLQVALPGPGGRSALLTGDIEADQEQAILGRAAASPEGLGSLHSTVLLVPHHGSKTSSTPPFLQAVAPSIGVIQAGRRNRYGHPAPLVLARYREMALPLAATPRCGAWLWSSDGSPARCWRDISPHYWYPPDASD
jgi:competence protein ComEC